MHVLNDRGLSIVGGGFGGSILAMCARSIGLETTIMERGHHPRFALGESSTPLANLILEEIAERYGLDELRPLVKYGSWKRAYPQIRCGPKRGFSFATHEPGRHFSVRPDRRNELLVASSPSEEEADTQWDRASVDQALARWATDRGVDFREGTEVVGCARGEGGPWHLRSISGAGRREERRDRASFLVDASGGARALHAGFGLDRAGRPLRTKSRALFGHFEGVGRFGDVYAALGGDAGPHPHPLDDAALHHLTPEGWVWVLRFDHGVTSLGAVLTSEPDGSPPDVEWHALLARYPSIFDQLGEARPLRPIAGSGWLQRRTSHSAGPGWAMLPGAAYFVDPILSPGNAHTLIGVQRLARALEEWPDLEAVDRRLATYDVRLQKEIDLVDDLAAGCYAALGSPELLHTFAMYYFAGAHHAETRRREGTATEDDGFLSAHEPELVRAVARSRAWLEEHRTQADRTDRDVEAFSTEVRSAIEPFNHIGLANPARRNLYPFA